MELANKELRKRIAWMTWHSQEGHIPSAFSIIDLVSVLYSKILKIDKRNLKSENRDYFILSKGHGCSALYAVLEKEGIITEDDILSKNLEHGILATHPDRNKIPGVEASTGSLGNGIGFALGIALGLKIDNLQNKVVALLGDAECNEGTVWECALLAPHLKLNNFFIIIDNNHSADPTLPLPDLPGKFRAFGWEVREVNGHSERDFLQSFKDFNLSNDKPKCIIANTIKGKGVPSMEENFGAWHSKIPNEAELLMINSAIDNYEQ
jgi:transketolase